MHQAVRRVFPFLDWFQGYKLGDLRADFVSGLTVALVLIPQSMAYAQLAGLPAYYGLYASFLPPMLAALFGSSRQLATGPVAIVSLMTAATLEPLATTGSAGFIAYAVFLALLVGIFQFTLGILRLGVVVNFLSHPVVIGFTNAAAIIIATSQLSKLFGVYVDKGEHHYETVIRVVQAAWDYTHWPTLALGVLAFAIMVVIKRINPRLPFVLVAVVVTTVISWAIGLEKNRTVDVAAIAAVGLVEELDRFNQYTTDIEAIAEARAILSPATDAIAHNGHDLCVTCHASHRVTPDMLHVDQPSELPRDGGMTTKTSLELHAMAGLLDRHIDGLKESASEARTALRRMRFQAVPGEDDGAWRFYPVGGVPAGAETDGNTWRIRVGNRILNPDSLTLTGGGAVVGSIPSGLPAFSVPKFDMSVFGRLFPAAIIISILGFMEAISIAKAMAARTGQRLDPNQELIGQGVANVLGSFGQSYAVSGSFSRSAVNIQAGAVSGLSSVVTSAMVVIVLMLFTPLLYHLPQAVLAAVIMLAVVGLINVQGIVHAWKVQRSDGVISVVSFAATLLFAPELERGIMIGVVLSVGVFLYRKMKPGVEELSLWRDGHLRSARHYNLSQCRHIAVVRFEGPLFFANTSYLEDEILDRTRSLPELSHIVFVCNGINEMDASGEEALSLLIDRLRSGGYEAVFCGLSERVVDTLHRSHLYDKIGDDFVFPTAVMAIESIWDASHKDSTETDCPLLSVVPIEGPKEEYRVQVLLVDDDEEFALSTAKRLNRRGFDIETASSGPAAIEVLKRRGFDVVVLDLVMPGMGGIEAMDEIHKFRPDQAIILLTGHVSIESAVNGVKHGAADYLQKPCSVEDLSGKIEKIYKLNA